MPLTPSSTRGGHNKTPGTNGNGAPRAPKAPRGALSKGLLQVIVIVFLCAILFMGALIQYHAALGIEHEESRNIGDYVSNIIKDDLKAIQSADIPGAVTRIEGELINKITKVVTDSSHISYVDAGSSAQGQTLDSTAVILKEDVNSRGAAISAPRQHVLSCPDADLVSYWKAPTVEDAAYITPFKTEGPTKYVTFEPDVGGWNNIRMQMELVLVFAAATGRTLVLPPDQPMYLLNKGKGHQKAHSFADFFPFDFIRERVPVIEMKEFMEKEALKGRLLNPNTGKVSYPPGMRSEFVGTDRDDRNLMWDYLRNATSCPPWKGMRDYLVIPPRPGMNTSLLPPIEAEYYLNKSLRFAGDKRYGMDRRAQYYDAYWHAQHVVHFISKPAWGYRLLEHFYTYIHFQDNFMDRYYKRFVRDFVHYKDSILCKAAMIIKKVKEEAGDAKFSSFHVRRGEFQYKNVKIPAADILNNIGRHIPESRLIYIATDEKDKHFFDAFKKRWPRIRFLDDYFEMAGLKQLNPNYLGMIDAIICTRGEEFVGTWFSTFTGYITRMRGYMGYPDQTVWYGDKEHMDRFQEYELPRFPFYMRENSISWFGIDEVDKTYWDKYFKLHPLKIDNDPWGKKKRAKGKAKGKGKAKAKSNGKGKATANA